MTREKYCSANSFSQITVIQNSNLWMNNGFTAFYNLHSGSSGGNSPTKYQLIHAADLNHGIYIRYFMIITSATSPVSLTLMLCLVGVNDSGRNGMKDELFYEQILRNFIPSSIPFIASYPKYHTFNLRWNAPFSPTFNFFSNLIIEILHSLKFISKLPSYLY